MSAPERKQVIVASAVIFGLFLVASAALFLVDLRFPG